MSRIPNPFLGGGDMQPKPPQTPTGPGFLLITRPPTASHSWRGAPRGRPFPPTPSPRYALSPPHPSDSFIPFSTGSNNNPDHSWRGGRGGRFSSQGSPRMFSPYRHSPRGGGGDWHMGSPAHNQGFTPTRHNRDSYGNQRHTNRFSFNGNSRGGRDNRGPISDIPVEKFVSPTMVKDPWAEFNVPTSTPLPTPDPLRRTSTLPLLDDSEIIIDSDTSVVVENSFEGGTVSGTEGDSSPVPDTGSDSPYVATSSTSDKDMASDSTGDD